MKLITSKLNPPLKHKGYIQRERLSKRLSQVLTIPITLIYGQAGSGKTTLLRESLDVDQEGYHWISCDESFNDIEVFFRYLSKSLNISEEKSYTSFDDYLIHLINEINTKDETVIIFDDFHHINDENLLRHFNVLLDNINENIHLVIASRHHLDLEISKRIMNQTIQIIHSEDLLFTRDESTQFLHKTMDLDDDEITSIIDMSEGWIGAMILLSQSSTKLSDHKINEGYLKEFILTQILRQFPEDLQVSLCEMAHLPFFNPRLLEISNSNFNGEEVISLMKKHKMMISEISNRKDYRFHHLLKDAFKSRDNISKLKMREYSKYFEEENYIVEALEVSEAIQDYGSIKRLVIEYPNVPTYYYYLLWVPVDEAVQSFEFIYQKFFYHFSKLDIEVCHEIYDKALIRIEEDPRFKAFLGINILIDPTDAKSYLDLVDVKDESLLTQSLVDIRNALALTHQDEYQKSLELLNESRHYLRKIDNSYIEFYIEGIYSQNFEELGYLEDAHRVYDSIFELLSTKTLFDYAAITYYVGRVGVYLKQVRLKEAQEYMNIAKSLSNVFIDNINQSLKFNQIEWYYINQENDKAYELLKNFLPYQQSKNFVMYSTLLKYPLILDQGSYDFKNNYQKSYNEYSGYKSLNIQLAYVLTLDDTNRQLELIDDSLVLAKNQMNILKIIEFDLVKIRLIEDERRKVSLFKEALFYASKHTILSPFIIQRDTVLFLYNNYHKMIIESLSPDVLVFYNSVLDHLNLLGFKQLSKREMEVLICISKDMSNQEIADYLFISLSTVKTHINNIYIKLETNSRVGALTIAKEYNLI